MSRSYSPEEMSDFRGQSLEPRGDSTVPARTRTEAGLRAEATARTASLARTKRQKHGKPKPVSLSLGSHTNIAAGPTCCAALKLRR